MERLKLALVHLDVRHGEPERNRDELVAFNTRAAESGAKIIVNTELAVSGYSFSSRDDIASLVESRKGVTIKALQKVASRYSCFIVLGYAERDDETDIYYNAAAVVGPDGKLLLNYRKITAEVRWACAGTPFQNNTFSTSWGTVGILICSDVYYGAIPRMSSLKGVDLLLVPANWPGGSLDPRELWQVRAKENGFFLAACNRSGKDRTMSCEDAYSCVYGANGERILESCNCESDIFYAELPLEDGRLFSHREKQLQSRKPSMYAPMYLDMRYAADLTSYYKLPEPAGLRLACYPVEQGKLFAGDVLGKTAKGYREEKADLLVLPAGRADDEETVLKRLSLAAVTNKIDICAGFLGEKNGSEVIVFAGKNGDLVQRSCESRDLEFIDLDNARIALVCKDELYHPETVMACAKQGCDVVVCASSALDDLDQLVLGSRSIEQTAVAVCGNDRAFICQPPEGHYRWAETAASHGKGCVATLDIGKLREKKFYDRLDYELLLRKR